MPLPSRRAAVALACLAITCLLSTSGWASSAATSDVEQDGRRLNSLTVIAPGGAACATTSSDAGGIVGAMALSVYMFIGLAIVCDEFFQPSLEKISEVLSLTPDVAGATFLAAGSSAPELFTSLGDTFGPGNSIGLGTIIGSAMFNILVIVALAAAVAEGDLAIDWRPVFRDVTFYLLSVFVMGIFFADGAVVAWEAAIMVAGYLLYIAIMVVNPRLLRWMDATFTCMAPKAGISRISIHPSGEKGSELSSSDEEAMAAKPMTSQPAASSKPPQAVVSDGADDDDDVHALLPEPTKFRRASKATTGVLAPNPLQQSSHTRRMSAMALKPPGFTDLESLEKAQGSAAAAADEVAVAAADEGEDDESRWDWPDGLPGQIFFLLSLPFLALFTVTIPGVANPKYERFYWVAFGMSIVWIGVICFFMVDAATYAGCALRIPPVLMGVIFLSVGTSIPDAIGSMLAAKAGEADMAIANAVGSNIFDILLGLGFPWLLQSLISGNAVPVDNDGALVSVVILLGTVGLFIGVLVMQGWKMTRTVGIFLFLLYIAYIAYNIIKISI